MSRSLIALLTVVALTVNVTPAPAGQLLIDDAAASIAADIELESQGFERALDRLHAAPVRAELERYGLRPADAERAIATMSPAGKRDIALLGNQLDPHSNAVSAGDRNLIITVVLVVAVAAVLVALVD